MLEYAAFEDLDLETMPSTAKTVSEKNNNASNAITLLLILFVDLFWVFIRTKLTFFIKLPTFAHFFMKRQLIDKEFIVIVKHRYTLFVKLQ